MPVIKKQVLLDAFYNYPNYTWTTISILEKIEQLPTIDAEPVKHGRWKVIYFDNIPTLGECSECGAIRRISNYCPNCGAKMEGERRTQNETD